MVVPIEEQIMQSLLSFNQKEKKFQAKALDPKT